MRGSNSNGNFVADYVAKRTAQMEKARLIREERKRGSVSSAAPSSTGSSAIDYSCQSTNKQHDQENSLVNKIHCHQHLSNNKPELQFNELNGSSSSRAPLFPVNGDRGQVQQSQAGSNLHRPKSTENVRHVMITEEDLRGAVSRCIITPDQCRQLWGVLTDPCCDQKMFNKKDFEHSYDPRNYSTRADNDVNRGPTNSVSHTNRTNLNKSWKKSTRYNPEDYEENYTDDEDEEVPPVMETRTPSNSKVAMNNNMKKEWNFDSAVSYDDANEVPQYFAQGHRKTPTSTGRVASKPEMIEMKSNKFTAAERSGTSERNGNPTGVHPLLRQQQTTGKKACVGSINPIPSSRQYDEETFTGLDIDEVMHFEAMKENQKQQFEEALKQAEKADSEPLVSCGLCGRKFRQGILHRHESVCAKINKKRKPIDMTKLRIQEIEGANEVLRNMKRQKKTGGGNEVKQHDVKQAGKIPKWKLQHEQFQAVLKAVNQPNDCGRAGGLQPPVMTPPELDDRVPCPHCGRKFASDTAERHIPKCANTINKPKSYARPPRRM